MIKLSIHDLNEGLKQCLAPGYFVFGDEPLQHKEAIDLIRKATSVQGFSREVIHLSQLEVPVLLEAINAPSLFCQHRLIECHLPELKKTKAVSDFLNALTPLKITSDIILLFITQKIDSMIVKSKEFINISSKWYCVAARALSIPETQFWIEDRLLKGGKKIEVDAVKQLMTMTENNLLAASQAIEKLLLMNKPAAITLEDVLAIAITEAHFSVYDLIEAALSGLSVRITTILTSLRQENVDIILINWAIAREIRLILSLRPKINDHSSNIFQAQGIWKKRELTIRAFMSRFSDQQLYQILLKLQQLDEVIKGRQLAEPWVLLLSICQTLASNQFYLKTETL